MNAKRKNEDLVPVTEGGSGAGTKRQRTTAPPARHQFEGQSREDREKYWDNRKLSMCQLAFKKRSLWPG
eukprot:COSAG04_NODE_13345_length_610_cov_0.792564_2_plen_68_part_01